MLELSLNEVYTKFKLNFYRQVFNRFQSNDEGLTATETFCMEAIYALNNPTINQFANFMRISQPNAAYKVNKLIRKGYLKKINSLEDKREYFLEVTEKFNEYYAINYNYIKLVSERIEKRFEPKDVEQIEKILRIMSEEMMPEMPNIRT